MKRVVAIDGPSGAGKSTVARGVADVLGSSVLDTGAMYRSATLAVLHRGVDPEDAEACADVARAADIDLRDGIRLDGRDVTTEIRGPAVTAAVSTVSAHPGVRAVLVARQREWADAHGGGVIEGRDIGTVVFPDAAVKVFLTASDAERARRRQRDEVAAAREVDVERVREDLDRRDRLDSTRKTSPLQAAVDAWVVDTTELAIPEVVAEIVERYRAATGAQT
ncbi:MAG: (d)CMP kinase [Acidimicrobiia bacterium]|jgi:cytidylate kinase|nr:(d)CMP kinase [Acidimicrobiia bacterium]